MNRLILLFHLFLLIISCNYTDTEDDFELQMIEKALVLINNEQTGSIVLRNKQGSFVLDSLKNDTLTILYSDFVIGGYTNIDSVQIYSNA